MKVIHGRTMSALLSSTLSNDVDTTTVTTLRQQQKRLLSLTDVEDSDAGNNDENTSMKKIAITPFQRTVYAALCLVPAGYVTTYKNIGRYIQCSSNQAIGQALKRNPYNPIIPCHRVIKSDGTIGGFHGQTSGENILRKISMLQNEGVLFNSSSTSSSTNGTFTVDPKCIFEFDENMKTQVVTTLKSDKENTKKRKL